MNDSISDPGAIQLITNKPDAERAAELIARIREAMKPVLALFDEAAANGLRVQWDAVAPSPHSGRYELNGLRLVKIFT